MPDGEAVTAPTDTVSSTLPIRFHPAATSTVVGGTVPVTLVVSAWHCTAIPIPTGTASPSDSDVYPFPGVYENPPEHSGKRAPNVASDSTGTETKLQPSAIVIVRVTVSDESAWKPVT